MLAADEIASASTRRRRERASEAASPALAIEGLVKRYPTGTEALKAVSVTVARASSSACWDPTAPASRR
jgi:hypothetical protein